MRLSRTYSSKFAPEVPEGRREKANSGSNRRPSSEQVGRTECSFVCQLRSVLHCSIIQKNTWISTFFYFALYDNSHIIFCRWALDVKLTTGYWAPHALTLNWHFKNFELQGVIPWGFDLFAIPFASCRRMRGLRICSLSLLYLALSLSRFLVRYTSHFEWQRHTLAQPKGRRPVGDLQ